MQQKKTEIDWVSIERANYRARQSIDACLEGAANLTKDPESKKRLVEAKCKPCFYLYQARIGGAAITDRACGICDANKTFSSTATDPICHKCADNNGLCVQCGGDIDSKNRRNPYPFMKDS